MKKRILPMIISLLLTITCIIVAAATGIYSPAIKTVGALVLVPTVTLLMFRFPYSTYVWTLCFIFFASPIGAILNFYRTFGAYDKIVHFFSGILLAEIGLRSMQYILEVYQMQSSKGRLLISLMFAATFSFSCAALWEVYEFCGDTLLNMNMQGKNANTMGDISSGVLGGVLFVLGYWIYKIRSTNVHAKGTKYSGGFQI